MVCSSLSQLLELNSVIAIFCTFIYISLSPSNNLRLCLSLYLSQLFFKFTSHSPQSMFVSHTQIYLCLFLTLSHSNLPMFVSHTQIYLCLFLTLKSIYVCFSHSNLPMFVSHTQIYLCLFLTLKSIYVCFSHSNLSIFFSQSQYA